MSRFIWLLLAFLLLLPATARAQPAAVEETAPPEPKHQLGGYVQGDGRFFLDDDDDAQSDRFELRRVRPSFKGTLWDHHDYKFLIDLAGGRLQVLDVFVDVKYVPWAVLRLGKGKTPFGLERLQSAVDLKFIERALPTQLVPNRDIGVQLVGDLAGGLLSYQVGVLDGVADGASADVNEDDRFDLVGRVFSHPFKQTGIPGLRGLGVGAAATRGERLGGAESPQIAPYRTAGGSTIFAYSSPDPELMPVVADGEHLRVTGQGYLYEGPIGFMAEYVWSRQQVSAGELSGEFAHTSWAASLTVLVTGDEATYKTVEPERPFDPLRGQWGAVEVGARYAQLDVDGDAFDEGLASADSSARRARALTFGATWYLNKVFKAQVNLERTTFDGGAPEGDRAAENALLARSQMAF
ncbi:MAG TPA: porin [Kofleriaceae bacterium]|nr:porin [Kofleriaceae bacterium]